MVEEQVERGRGGAGGDRVGAGDQVLHLQQVVFGVGDDLQEAGACAQEGLGGLALGGLLRGLRLAGEHRAAVEDGGLDAGALHGVLGEEAGKHGVVERHLQPVLHVRRGGALHVRHQDAQPAVLAALQAQDVHVAADGPAAEHHLQTGLEADDHLARRQAGCLLQDAVVVGRTVAKARAHLARQVKGAVARLHVRLYLPLEAGAGAGEQGRNGLGGDAGVLQEARAGTAGVHAQAQVAVALLQADVLRDIRRGDLPLGDRKAVGHGAARHALVVRRENGRFLGAGPPAGRQLTIANWAPAP